MQEDTPDVSIQFPGTPVWPALPPDFRLLSNYNLVRLSKKPKQNLAAVAAITGSQLFRPPVPSVELPAHNTGLWVTATKE